MHNNLTFTLPLPDGHLGGPNNHLTILPVMHRPAYDQLAIEVENNTQPEFAFSRCDLRDIRHPLGLGFQCAEVTLQMVPDIRWSSAGDP